MKIKYFIAASLMFAAQNALAAGFDCTLTGLNETEKTICADTYLSGLDNVTNGYFVKAMDNSYSVGTLARDQRKWLAERNRCGTDAECIKQRYIERNKILSRAGVYHKISDVFTRPGDKLDKPVAPGLKSEAGFTLSEEPWRVRPLITSSDVANLTVGTTGHYLSTLTHRIVNNDLIVFVVLYVEKDQKKGAFLLRLKDGEKPRVEAVYEGYNLELSLLDKNGAAQGDILYSVAEYRAPGVAVNSESDFATPQAFALKVSAKEIGNIIEVTPPASEPANKKWVGYCGSNECNSRLTSPDGQWRLASADRSNSEIDEGMYVFPHDRPDAGMNVFLPQADTAKGADYSYDRNYVWGRDSSFYFDNEGGYACIWKTDLADKTTKRILPVEAFLQPHYVNYNGEDMIIASYTYYNENGDYRSEEVYLAKK
ncbi:lysozyme inhibitor LprI family protein [Serratia proteamaculans]